MSIFIESIEALDLRVPTSDTLLGSDPFHKKPNYSCVYTQIKLSNGIEGQSVCFTSGAGNDWIAYGVKDIAKLLDGYNFNGIPPSVVDGNIIIRPIMYLALSYDHRIIDGKESVSFLKMIKENIEDPRRLFLDI